MITGFSGAGKSTVLAALEDVGYYCMDNLPVPLLPKAIELFSSTHPERPIAVGIDAREAMYLQEVPAIMEELSIAGHRIEILFLEASVDTLIRRYSETRRKHPMGELPQAIKSEQIVLKSLKNLTTTTISTTNLHPRELRHLIRQRYGKQDIFEVLLMSFGYKRGIPAIADMVFDARFLPNPFEIAQYRHQTGLVEAVAAYVLQHEDAQKLLGQIHSILQFVLPRSFREGRSCFTVAIGCTGGQHRSVALMEALYAHLKKDCALFEPPPKLTIRHRDIHHN